MALTQAIIGLIPWPHFIPYVIAECLGACIGALIC